jgi:tetraacyldisaccharide 4'-kinase
VSSVPSVHPHTPSPHEERQTLETRLLRVVDGAPGIGAALVRGVLSALSGLYRLGLEIDLATYRLGLARVTRLPATVIGIGNLSVGGTGKTLATFKLARQLSAEGKRVAILSRGYKRRSAAPIAVVSTPAALCLTPSEAGDEPYLLASNLPGIPVLVGKNRRVTGRHAIEAFGADVLILDDSFQYWRLHKDHEIVLIDALQPPARNFVLPRGLLREPWSHLSRAHEVWLTHAHLAPPERVEALTALVRRHAPAAQVRYTEHRPLYLHSPHGQQAPLQTLHQRHVLALSGLGNPEQFERMLTSLGAHVHPCRFPDHHHFTDDELHAIAASLPPNTLVVTTPKDAIRLPKRPPFPLWIIEVALAEEPWPR